METTSTRPPSLWTIAAVGSAGAAVMHAAAAGIHAEHPATSRVFVALALLQGAVAVGGFLTPRRLAGVALGLVNLAAAAGWVITRTTGIGWIDGLEASERPQLADSIAVALAVIAVVAAGAGLAGVTGALHRRGLVNMAAIAAGLALVPGLANATNHAHDTHGDGEVATAATPSDDHAHEPGEAAEAAGAGEQAGAAADGQDDASLDAAHDHSSADAASDASSDESSDAATPVWPRAWDPTQPIDFSGVPGVTAEQQARAEQLVANTMRDLPAFADVTSIEALGYRSIGDARTGVEHFVNYAMFSDDKFLDPTAPESLVYRVDGDARTLVSAMFIASETPIDDPELIDFGGPLMQWHVHTNLCWALDDDGQPTVVAVLETPSDTCPSGTINAGGGNPMVHVWIAPHECGPFAALEGHGAGQVDDSTSVRVDQCGAEHGDDHGEQVATETASGAPYDPTMPIDLGGLPGVTPQQQAFAENLVASTLRDLPQWSDVADVTAAGFQSIGDGATGHEHYIQWEWIDDDVWLDPDQPESLVFEPQPDGSKKLVSAMYMLPPGTEFDEIPDWGGDLMQWHVHGDLCFTSDPVRPLVAGLKPLGEMCPAPLVDGPMSPMIHVWIESTPCGPFAALEGIAGGQVPEGEDVLCDTAHGSH